MPLSRRSLLRGFLPGHRALFSRWPFTASGDGPSTSTDDHQGDGSPLRGRPHGRNVHIRVFTRDLGNERQHIVIRCGLAVFARLGRSKGGPGLLCPHWKRKAKEQGKGQEGRNTPSPHEPFGHSPPLGTDRIPIRDSVGAGPKVPRRTGGCPLEGKQPFRDERITRPREPPSRRRGTHCRCTFPSAES